MAAYMLMNAEIAGGGHQKLAVRMENVLDLILTATAMSVDANFRWDAGRGFVAALNPHQTSLHSEMAAPVGPVSDVAMTELALNYQKALMIAVLASTLLGVEIQAMVAK